VWEAKGTRFSVLDLCDGHVLFTGEVPAGTTFDHPNAYVEILSARKVALLVRRQDSDTGDLLLQVWSVSGRKPLFPPIPLRAKNVAIGSDAAARFIGTADESGQCKIWDGESGD